MTIDPQNLTSIDGESVIRFSNPSPLIFTQNQKIILNTDLVRNINDCLLRANLGALAHEGIECMFMGEGDASWRKAKLRLSPQLVLDEVEGLKEEDLYKSEFD